jgi:hypothetical protein
MSDYSVCALLETSQVQCWGENAKALSPDQSRPAFVPGLAGVTTLASGQFGDVCATLMNGRMTCFFAATSSALGIDHPVTTTGDTKEFQVVSDHYCTRADNDSVNCRGYYEMDLNFEAPTVDIASFSTGAPRGGCYITKAGASECWERDSITRKMTLNPARSFASGVTRVTGSAYGGCTFFADNTIKCILFRTLSYPLVGSASDFISTNDPLCFANITTKSIDCVVQGQAGVKRPYPTDLQISAGETVQIWDQGQGGCVMKLSGALLCWGTNESGQLGNGTTTASAAAVSVAGLEPGVANFSVGTRTQYNGTTPSSRTFVCAVLKNQTMKCWGSNSRGELGEQIRSVDNQLTPVTMNDSQPVMKVALGEDGGCRLGADRNLRCWGSALWAMSARKMDGLVEPASF